MPNLKHIGLYIHTRTRTCTLLVSDLIVIEVTELLLHGRGIYCHCAQTDSYSEHFTGYACPSAASISIIPVTPTLQHSDQGERLIRHLWSLKHSCCYMPVCLKRIMAFILMLHAMIQHDSEIVMFQDRMPATGNELLPAVWGFSVGLVLICLVHTPRPCSRAWSGLWSRGGGMQRRPLAQLSV